MASRRKIATMLFTVVPRSRKSEQEVEGWERGGWEAAE